MPELVTASALAAMLGVSGQAVRKARATGRLSSINGKFDPAVARIQWEANRQRRRASNPTEAAPAGQSGAGSEYWRAKTDRERSEAEIAALKAGELRGDLVRRAEVERAIAGRIVSLREALETIGDRVGALLAAESNALACRTIVMREIRQALRGFVEASGHTEPAPAASGPQA